MGAQERLTTFLVMVITVSFFLPWITVESQAVGGFSKILTGKDQGVIDSISGFRVPLLANSKESRFMISVIKIFNPQIRDADKKSYLLWGVPLIAMLISLAGCVFKHIKIIRFFLGLIAVGIVCAVIYKLMSTDMDKLVLKVNIVYGLWLTLFGFFAIGVSELASALYLQKGSAKAVGQAPQQASVQSADKARETLKKKTKKGLFLKVLGLGFILFAIAGEWAEWGLATGFDPRQIGLLALGLLFLLYGLLVSKSSHY
ncbi:MAG: hypothetical protein ABIJ41_04020 [Candidatus Omnitrophota bacterium]